MNDLNKKIIESVRVGITPEGQLTEIFQKLIETVEAVTLYENAKSRNSSVMPLCLKQVKSCIGDFYTSLVIHSKVCNVRITSDEFTTINQSSSTEAFSRIIPPLLRLAIKPNEDDYFRAIFELTLLAQNHNFTLRECVSKENKKGGKK